MSLKLEFAISKKRKNLCVCVYVVIFKFAVSTRNYKGEIDTDKTLETLIF